MNLIGMCTRICFECVRRFVRSVAPGAVAAHLSGVWQQISQNCGNIFVSSVSAHLSVSRYMHDV